MSVRRLVVARRSRTMSAKIVTKETMRVEMVAAEDVVDAEVEAVITTTITIRVTETTTKMVETSTVVAEEATTNKKSPRDLKLEMVTRSLATDPQEISTRITKTPVEINKNPTGATTVAEAAPTSMVTDLNVLTIKAATAVDLEEDVLEAREVDPSQMLMVVTNNDDHDLRRLVTC